MVQGLRTRLLPIKFSHIMPVAALLFVAFSTLFFHMARPRTILTPRGTFISLSGGRTRPSVIATAVNLPALVIAVPLELAIFPGQPGTQPYHEPFRLLEFTCLGILFWFIIGRAMDDWIVWRQLRSGSRWRLMDCIIAALIALEASALAVQFSARFKWDQDQLWYLAGAIGWALLGYSAFVFRIAQLRAYPRARGKTQAG
jgi:hypothetical protein